MVVTRGRFPLAMATESALRRDIFRQQRSV